MGLAGFDFATFDESVYDDSVEWQDYIASAKAVSNRPRIRVVFDDANWDSYLLAAPRLSRDVKLTAGVAAIRLSNVDQSWNLFLASDANLYKKLQLQLYFYDDFVGAERVVALLEGTQQCFFRSDADFPASGITGANPLSIEAWIKPMSVAEGAPIVAKWSGYSNKQMYRFYRKGAALVFDVHDGASVGGAESPACLEEREWSHVAVTYDPGQALGSRVAFYRDGEAVGTSSDDTPGSIQDGDPDFTVCYCADFPYDAYWRGGVSRVALFADVRTPAEIAVSAADPDANLGAEQGVSGFWEFDEYGSATQIVNHQGDVKRNLVCYDDGYATFSECGRTVLPYVYTLFTGMVEDVSYVGTAVTLRVKDKMASMLEKPIGSGLEAYGYYATYYTPSALAWNILTYHGELDSSYDEANPDIDYLSWKNWQTSCNDAGYKLRARFTGQSVRDALLEIGRLTNSYIWVNHDGKFAFKMFQAPWAGQESLDRSNCKRIDAAVKEDNIINKCYCRHNFNPDTDEWGVKMLAEDTDSQSMAWGIRAYTEESRIVWHDDSLSASTYAQSVIDKYAWPEKIVKIEAFMIGFLIDLCDRVYITEPLRNLDEESFFIENVVSMDLATGKVDLEGRKI